MGPNGFKMDRRSDIEDLGATAPDLEDIYRVEHLRSDTEDPAIASEIGYRRSGL